MNTAQPITITEGAAIRTHVLSIPQHDPRYLFLDGVRELLDLRKAHLITLPRVGDLGPRPPEDDAERWGWTYYGGLTPWKAKNPQIGYHVPERPDPWIWIDIPAALSVLQREYELALRGRVPPDYDSLVAALCEGGFCVCRPGELFGGCEIVELLDYDIAYPDVAILRRELELILSCYDEDDLSAVRVVAQFPPPLSLRRGMRGWTEHSWEMKILFDGERIQRTALFPSELLQEEEEEEEGEIQL